MLGAAMVKCVIENDNVTERDYGVGCGANDCDWTGKRFEVSGVPGFNLRLP